MLDAKITNEKDFELAKGEAQRANQTLANVLIGRGLVTEEYLIELLGEYFNIPKIDLSAGAVAQDALEILPESIAKSKRVVVFDKKNIGDRCRIKVAMNDPIDLQIINFIEVKTNCSVEPYFATISNLNSIFKQYKRNISEDFNKIIEENIAQAAAMDNVGPEKLAENVPIISILDSIIEYAISLNSSDIHFEPLEDKLLVRFRIDGILKEIVTLPKIINPALIARIKIISNLAIDEHLKPQDGRFKYKLEEQYVDVRVSVMPTFYGEKSVMRLLRGSARPLNLSELGFSEAALKIIQENIKKTHGMILSTGPTGSGKTTTLYTILNILNTPDVNIVTVEDPIEYDIPRINQTQVNTKAGITFATGLRSLLRQNPDIMMVGEIRDSETAEIAIHSALTGHLVLSTLHTNDAPTAIPRLIDIGIEPFLIASTVNLIIAQRLVRKICPQCITSLAVNPDIAETIKEQLILVSGAAKRKIPATLYQGTGCKFCGGSGYRGQIGIFEILNVDAKMRDLIIKRASIDELKKAAIAGGMKTMFEDGLDKAEAGVTTIDEVLRVVRE